MGSRIMHLLIADRITQHITIEDKASFLLGGIAPDAVVPKDRSHFYAGDVSDYTRNINYGQFLAKYSTHTFNPFILGYYTHLIADDLWLKGFYLPWLKNRMENNQEILDKYHNDFRLLNGKLLNYYHSKEVLKKYIKSGGEIVDIQEVSRAGIDMFIPDVLADMDYTNKDLEQDLQVFTFNQMIGYIETSVDQGVMQINKLLKTV